MEHTDSNSTVQNNATEQPTIATLQAQIDSLKAEMTATLAAQKQQAEQDLAALKLDAASKITARTSPDVSSGSQDIAIQKAVKAVGGLSKWSLLTPVQKAEAIGMHGSAEITDKELRLLFGKSSNSQMASQLMASNPARYRRLKTEAKLRGIF